MTQTNNPRCDLKQATFDIKSTKLRNKREIYSRKM